MYKKETTWCPDCKKDTTHYYGGDILTCGECGYMERIANTREDDGGEAEARFEPIGEG